LDDFEIHKGFTPTGRTVIVLYRILFKLDFLLEAKLQYLKLLNKFMKIIMTCNALKKGADFDLNIGINVIWYFMMIVTSMTIRKKILKIILVLENFMKLSTLVRMIYSSL
jgi:hypothetical protein